MSVAINPVVGELKVSAVRVSYRPNLDHLADVSTCDLVAGKNHDWLLANARAVHRSEIKSSSALRSFVLLDFSMFVESDYVLAFCSENGLTSANIHDLVAFGDANLVEQYFSPILALGTIWNGFKGSGFGYVSYLAAKNGSRTICADSFSCDWGAGWSFLAYK